MALKKIYIGSFGPSLYDDTDDVDDVDGDFSGKTQQALVTDGAADVEGDLSVGGDLDVTGDADVTGAVSADSFALADTDNSHHLSLTWNEDSAADYVLNLLVGGGTRSLTLNENFTIDDGSAGTLTFGSVCTLTVELTSVLNQDLTTDASPTFAGCSLGTGELTAGSINRASGSLTLEIAGNAVITVAATSVTLAQTAVLSTCIDAGADVDKFLVLDASNNVDYRTGAEVFSDIGVVSECTSVTAPLVLTDYGISIPAATNAAAGHATAAHITALEVNSAKVTCNFANVQTALAVASGAVDFNSQALTSAGAIGCGAITAAGDIIAGADASIKITADARIYANAGTNDSLVFNGKGTGGVFINWDDGTGGFSVGGGTAAAKLKVGSDGLIKIGGGAAAAQLHVDQSSTTAAIPVLTLDQGDQDAPSINFIGTQGAGAAYNINTTEFNDFTRMVMVEYNGVMAWIKLYSTPD